MTVFFADDPIEPKSIVACPECGFEFSFNHSEGWSEEEGYRFVCYRCRAEQAEKVHERAFAEALAVLEQRRDEWREVAAEHTRLGRYHREARDANLVADEFDRAIARIKEVAGRGG